MPAQHDFENDINWLKERLDSLPDPVLPSSLSAQSLFARLEELERDGAQPEDESWMPMLVSAFTGEDASADHTSPVRNWKRWRPALSVAAVFLLVAMVYWRGILPTIKGAGNMAPQAMSSSADYDTGGGEAADYAENFSVTADDQEEALASPMTGGQEAGAELFMDSSNPDGGSQSRALGNMTEYELAIENVVLNFVMDDSAGLTELYATPAELFEKADFVVVAYMSPDLSSDAGAPVTTASLSVTTSIKGNSAQEISQISYTGGCVSVQEQLEQMPYLREENIRIMESDYGLSEDEINTGYIYINVGSRPVIKTNVAYVLFLKEKGADYFLMDSQYALLPVEDGTIKDFDGKTYGSVERPRLG